MGAGADDAELIQRCLEGRKGAWDEFVDRYSRLVYWSIWKILENQHAPSKEELCREVFQDFFEKVLERARLERLRRAGNLKSYIRSMVCHLVFDRLRQSSRQASLESSVDFADLEASGPDGGEALLAEETKGTLTFVMETLSAKERACVELCYIDDRTHREIGLLLHMPQDTVSTILRRTKERLRQALEEKGISG